MQNNELEFLEIDKNSEIHISELFQILKKRKFNISHEDLPDFNNHRNFVLNHPYRLWKIVKNKNKIIGTFYITYDNAIGIHLIKPSKTLYESIIKKIFFIYKPLKENKSIRSKYFLINVNPANIKLIKALKVIGLEHIQNTYAYKNLN